MVFGIFGLGPIELAVIAVVLLGGIGVAVYMMMGSGKGGDDSP